MFKSALMTGLIGISVLASGAAFAEGQHHGGYHHGGNHSGGFINIRIMPPPPPPRPRCVPGNLVDDMQADQAGRIRDGRRSGDLTQSEVATLNAQQDRIAAAERRMRSDGCLTLAERNDLVARLEAAARDIYRERNDHERRGGRDDRGGHGGGHGGHGGHHGSNGPQVGIFGVWTSDRQ